MKKLLLIAFTLYINIIIFSNFTVLILNSYSPDYDWTSEMNRGIEEMFNANKIKYHTEYMDAKSNFSALYIKHYQDLLEEKYRNQKIDAIIVTDKEAFQFIHILGEKTFGTKLIGFVGVEDISKDYISKYPNFFGIYGDVEIRKTVNQALDQHASVKNIISVFSADIPGGNYSEIFKNEKNYFFTKNMININAENTQDAIKKINQIKDNSIVLIGNVMKNGKNELINLEEAASEISNNIKYPSYALWSNQIGNGVIGGVVSNPYMQGKQIANLMVKKLAGEEIPQLTPKEFYPMYDYNILKKYNIPIKKIPKDSLIINSPNLSDNLIDILYLIIGLIIILIVIIIIFTRYTFKLNQEKKKFELESMQDTLTKVYNRRYLEKTEKEWVEEIVIVFVFDVDYLKEINDNYGHDVGDRYIIKVAELLKDTFRKQDIISRIGGDEFIALIKTKPEETEHAIRRILYSLEINLKNMNKNLEPKLSISYGYAIKEINFEDALRKADENMYENKRNKRRK